MTGWNRKTMLSILLAVMMVAALLSGCGSNNDKTSNSNAPSPSGSSAAQQNPNAEPESKKLVVYAALNEDDIVKIQQKFKEDTGIEIEYLRMNGAGEASTRVQAEKDHPKADILIGGSVEFYGPLAEQGLLEAYSSPNNKDLDPVFNDPKGFWQGWYMGVLGIVLNTERFEKELAPKGLTEPQTWDDLLDPRYKDYFINSNPATAGAGYIFVADQLFRLGEEKGWEYIRQLHQNVHHYAPSVGDTINLVATGEFAVAMSWAHDIIKSQQKGYPIKVIVPPDTAYEIGGVAIVKGGANTANAKKFIDWLLTKETGEMNTKLSNRYSVRKDVEPPQGMIKIEDVKLVAYDRAKAAAMKQDVLNKFAEITGVSK